MSERNFSVLKPAERVMATLNLDRYGVSVCQSSLINKILNNNKNFVFIRCIASETWPDIPECTTWIHRQKAESTRLEMHLKNKHGKVNVTVHMLYHMCDT